MTVHRVYKGFEIQRTNSRILGVRYVIFKEGVRQGSSQSYGGALRIIDEHLTPKDAA